MCAHLTLPLVFYSLTDKKKANVRIQVVLPKLVSGGCLRVQVELNKFDLETRF